MHDTGVSQLVVSVTKELPLAAKEVVGTVRELELMDRVYRDDGVLDRPVGDICSGAMPMIGIGEPVAHVVELLDHEPSVLVIDGGHPVGVFTRSDVLSFLGGACAMSSRDLGFETRAIHAGQEPDPTTGAVVPPISLATTFAQEAVGKHRGYEYARSGNPTRERARGLPRVARRRGPRARVRERPRRRGRVVPHALDPVTTSSSRPTPTAGRSGSSRGCTSGSGIEWSAVDLGDLDAVAGAWHRRDPHGLDRDADEPRCSTIVDIEAVAKLAHARRRARRRRQHVRDAVPPTALGTRGRRGGALEHEVPRRSLGCRRRIRRDARRRAGRRAPVPPERDGCGAVAVRLLPRAPRREDPRCPHGPALRERRAVVDVLRNHDAVERVSIRVCPIIPVTTSPLAR